MVKKRLLHPYTMSKKWEERTLFKNNRTDDLIITNTNQNI